MFNDMFNRDRIVHYGRKGMKWGVRKDKRGGGAKGRRTLQVTSKKSKSDLAEIKGMVDELDKPAHKDSARATKIKKKKGMFVEELSNKQMETAIKRIRLEKEYKSLNPSVLDHGKKAIGTVVSQIGKQVTAQLVNKAAGSVAKSILILAEKS